MSDNFTHAAVSLDKGGILLIYGKPNLLECNAKDMKMIYLPKIILSKFILFYCSCSSTC